MKKTTKIILIGGAGIGLATAAIVIASKNKNNDGAKVIPNNNKGKKPHLPDNNNEKPTPDRKLACQNGDGYTCMVDIFAPEFVKFRKLKKNQFEILTKSYKNYKTKDNNFNEASYLMGKNGKYAKVSFSYTDRLVNKNVKMEFEYKRKRFSHKIIITRNGQLYKEIKL